MDRVVQWNVFEDGLTNAPGNIGWSAAFATRIDDLIHALSLGENGRRFYGFKPTRDFTVVPSVVVIDSGSRLFGYIDVAYASIYHSLGGEVLLDGGGPSLGNSLRTLYLKATRDEERGGRWETPEFRAEV